MFGFISEGSAWAGEAKLGLAYGPKPLHKIDVFLPQRNDTRARTAVLFFHGGGWHRGSRKPLRYVGRALASMGYVGFSADYRLYPEVRFPTFVEDAARAVAFIRANAKRFGVAPDRIYLMGHSAGAHIAMLLTLDPRYLKAAGVPRASILGTIGLAGPYRLEPSRWPRIAPIFETHPEPDNVSPASFAANTGPRLLLLHGEDDRIVGAKQSRLLAGAYGKAGGAVRAQIYPKVGHNGVLVAFHPALRWRAPVYQEVRRFVGEP